MTNFWKAVESMPPSVVNKKIEYRLYYDELGEPICYSQEELAGEYIIVDKETYDNGRYDIHVHNHKIISIVKYTVQKLIPVNTSKGTECLQDDVSIIGEGQYWALKKY